MSEGNNSAFKKQKHRFLRNHPLTVGFLETDMPDQAGIFDFDIQTRRMGGGIPILEVLGFGNRNKETIGTNTHRISAYWLPWESERAVHLDIGDAADYFFTSEINGCQFRVARRGPNTVRTIHVAGNSISTDTRVGSRWRNEQAEALLTPGQRVLSRRFTRSSLLGNNVPGPNGFQGQGTMVGYDGPHLWQNVIGFRHWHVFGPSTWEFWYQTVANNGAGYTAQATLLCRI